MNTTSEEVDRFVENGGEIVACGTCIHLRGMEEIEVCPIGTMKTLIEMIEEADRIITFG